MHPSFRRALKEGFAGLKEFIGDVPIDYWIPFDCEDDVDFTTLRKSELPLAYYLGISPSFWVSIFKKALNLGKGLGVKSYKKAFGIDVDIQKEQNVRRMVEYK